MNKQKIPSYKPAHVKKIQIKMEDKRKTYKEDYLKYTSERLNSKAVYFRAQS